MKRPFIVLAALFGVLCWRFRRWDDVELLVALVVFFVTNSAVVAAASTVHHRYQSRIAWLACLALFVLVARLVGARRRVPSVHLPAVAVGGPGYAAAAPAPGSPP